MQSQDRSMFVDQLNTQGFATTSSHNYRAVVRAYVFLFYFMTAFDDILRTETEAEATLAAAHDEVASAIAAAETEKSVSVAAAEQRLREEETKALEQTSAAVAEQVAKIQADSEVEVAAVRERFVAAKPQLMAKLKATF